MAAPICGGTIAFANPIASGPAQTEHQRAVHREQLVVGRGVDQLPSGRRQLGRMISASSLPTIAKPNATDVQDADPLVVGRGQPFERSKRPAGCRGPGPVSAPTLPSIALREPAAGPGAPPAASNAAWSTPRIGRSEWPTPQNSAQAPGQTGPLTEVERGRRPDRIAPDRNAGT
jgi:hypothetical protein